MDLFTLGFTFVIGCVSLGMGIYTRRRGFSPWMSKTEFGRGLAGWRVFDTTLPSPQMLNEIEQSWGRLRAMFFFGFGAGVLVLCAVLSVLSWLVTGSAAADANLDGSFYVALFYLFVSAGTALGGVFGIWHLRRTAQRRMTYADLHRRRLTDYRDLALLWMMLLIVLETILFSLLLASHVLPTFTFLFFSDKTLALHFPNTLCMLAIVPITMLLVIALAELLQRRVVHLSRLLVTDDPEVSLRADNMLRSMVLASIQGYTLMTLFLLGVFQGNLIMRSYWASGYWQMGNRPGVVLIDIFMFVVVVTACISAFRIHSIPRSKDPRSKEQTSFVQRWLAIMRKNRRGTME